MKKIILAILLLPTLASAAQKFPPEVSAALQFNKWYISQIIIGKEPLKNYEALRPYVTRETISKLKAMDKLDPDEYDVPDVDMFIKAQGYEDDWGAELFDPAEDWAEHVDFDLNPDFFAEVVIGLADEDGGEINDIFARVLLCREKDHKLCHILWRE